MEMPRLFIAVIFGYNLEFVGFHGSQEIMINSVHKNKLVECTFYKGALSSRFLRLSMEHLLPKWLSFFLNR